MVAVVPLILLFSLSRSASATEGSSHTGLLSNGHNVWTDGGQKDHDKVVTVVRLEGKTAQGRLSKEQYPDHLRYAIQMGDSKHILNIWRNDLSIQHHSEYNVEPCFYHGTVEGDLDSSVGLSTCDGLKGYFIIEGVGYGLDPLEGEETGRHRLVPLDVAPERRTSCGLKTHSIPHLHQHFGHDLFTHSANHTHMRRRRHVVLPSTRYLELLLVLDNTLFEEMYQANRSALVKDLLYLTNLVDSFYKRLQVRVVLVDFSVLSAEDEIPVVTEGESASDVLGRFLNWRQNNSDILPHHDNAQLLTKKSFGTVLGMAYVGTICMRTSGGIVTMGEMLLTAAVMAHELGHNLGMGHDDERWCLCPSPEGCLMAASIRNPPATAFSNCSEEDLGVLVKGGTCLLNLPTKSLQPARCGNLIVDAGEECDCGSVEECKNECCDPSTCKLSARSWCAHGECCKHCVFMSHGETCRSARGPCDVPEFCNGSSSFCPNDRTVLDGRECLGGDAYCYQGSCFTLLAQCESIWGEGATVASEQCFLEVNSKGNEFGNCGRNPKGRLQACERRNVKCGKVVCESTASWPLFSHMQPHFAVYKKCRAVDYNQGSDVLDLGLVQTGTKCGPDKVCIDHRCVNVSLLGYYSAKADICNGHGNLNDLHHCHCHDGWMPPYCSSLGCGGSIDSGPTCKGRHRLWPLALVVSPLLFAAWIYYSWRRHRTALRHPPMQNNAPQSVSWYNPSLSEPSRQI
uniref:disintegrin and metalloproteinase domain-containing protein 9-like isoform X2 n=1 Tax=Myxine glutinosa TaxID=7769 RepID=UPI00358DED2F